MTQAGQAWAARVAAEHEQADRVRSDDPGSDFWKGLAHRFVAASREEAYRDETLVALLPIVKGDDTILDVGAGAGRLAVPLAEHCKRVIAVEPSEAMRERLVEQARAWGAENVEVIAERWEDAKTDQADLVICAHVIYTVEDIEGFLRKLLSHARREVAIVVFEEPAMANYFPLWTVVHGEERVSLPALQALTGVLDEMGVRHSERPLAQWQSRPFKDFEGAVTECMTRLFVGKDSDKVRPLREAVCTALKPVEGGFRFEWAKPHRPWLVKLAAG